MAPELTENERDWLRMIIAGHMKRRAKKNGRMRERFMERFDEAKEKRGTEFILGIYRKMGGGGDGVSISSTVHPGYPPVSWTDEELARYRQTGQTPDGEGE